MTERELIAIENRGRDSIETHADFMELLSYSEHQSDMISSCWLALDTIARLPGSPSDVKDICIRVLRNQQCPGWKS